MKVYVHHVSFLDYDGIVTASKISLDPEYESVYYIKEELSGETLHGYYNLRTQDLYIDPKFKIKYKP